MMSHPPVQATGEDVRDGHESCPDPLHRGEKPILFLDVDGVISVFGFQSGGDPPGRLHWIDGVAHCIVHGCAGRLHRLGKRFELVWATGWEHRANHHLPALLELPHAELPVLTFGGRAIFGSAHWKLDAIDAYAGDRPAAWIDDNLDDQCEVWASERPAPTLLVKTGSATGISDQHVDRLLSWADDVASVGLT